MNSNITEIIDHVVTSITFFRPEVCLIITFIICIFASLFVRKKQSFSAFIITIVGFLFSSVFLIQQLANTGTGFFNMIHIDNLAIYSRLVIAIGAIITAIFIQQRQPRNNGDVHTVLIAATIGMFLLTMTTHWLVIFIGIEMVSIASYILVGYFSTDKKQSEAAMKYALFGSVCAAIMLYGLSLIYGLTGNLDFSSLDHIKGLMTAPDAIVSIATLFIFVGFGFKLGFVPLHIWTPDVYQGAPTAITAFLSTLPKMAAFILLARLYQAWSDTLFYFSELVTSFIIVLAIITMLVGNLAALRQTDAKRLMAYSSIGHTGFLLMAIFAYKQSFEYLLFYLIAYTIMNFIAFIFIDYIEKYTKSSSLLSYSGLGKQMPLLFTLFTFVAISLIGLPPTMGFVGKLMVFTSVFDIYQESNNTFVLLMLIIGALTSVISLFFYFRLPLYAFLKEGKPTEIHNPPIDLLTIIAIFLTLLLLLLGLFPNLLLDILR
ncbi:NADH-quinone oxidoreductase subunit N [Sphingobacterium sp. UT-1RO-CII-1]|uniref:NADH-quinone oxidoreductase subunit N n=1 Tax=Sphingobacterium sp. UT-1RO-CII-1 TaxID=2995225 RepID=UPI00227AC11B|nr:NADH-quinone oxidoreductase subunit N [Sphingobacterium sp. UT-1RO-CII-1]MCY4779937.1 NADH-quinone oxidoreductase subunit N [Sphingobacterium sp. UT-1RO-CII-1]